MVHGFGRMGTQIWLKLLIDVAVRAFCIFGNGGDSFALAEDDDPHHGERSNSEEYHQQCGRKILFDFEPLSTLAEGHNPELHTL